LTRSSSIGHLATVTVAPIPSTVRDVPSEVILDVDDGMKGRCAVNQHNAVTIAQARLGRRIGNLGAARMEEVCAALRFALGC
jgi:mRNA interferase MazF